MITRAGCATTLKLQSYFSHYFACESFRLICAVNWQLQPPHRVTYKVIFALYGTPANSWKRKYFSELLCENEKKQKAHSLPNAAHSRPNAHVKRQSEIAPRHLRKKIAPTNDAIYPCSPGRRRSLSRMSACHWRHSYVDDLIIHFYTDQSFIKSRKWERSRIKEIKKTNINNKKK